MAPATTSTSTRHSSIPRRRGFISGARTARRSFWRTWETLKLGEFDSPQTARNVHFLTVYRQMTREQVMRFFIDAYIATTNGVRQRPIAHLIKHARSVRMCALCYIPYLTP